MEVEQVVSYLASKPLLVFAINAYCLFTALGLKIHMLVHSSTETLPTLSGSRVSYYCFSPLKTKWLIFTTICGLIFSPALVLIYCLFKISNYNDKDSYFTYNEDKKEGRSNKTFTKKFYYFYEDEICKNDGSSWYYE